MKAAIFANGVIENDDRAVEAAKSADLVIAADGGARHCLRLGIRPGLVIGDLDSLDKDDQRALRTKGTEFVAHPREKDQTDLELALLAAVGHNAETIRILGAMGGRLDMTVANILLLSLPELSDTDVELWHGDQTAWLIRPPGGTLRAEPGDTISLIPLGGEARGITSQDLEYSLENGSLQRGPAKGVSNVVSGPNPQIELSAGALLVVLTPERS